MSELHELTDDALLDRLFPVLGLIEDWLGDVRGRIEERLFAGASFASCKLVEGRRGARAWDDEDAAEALLKKFQLKHDEMYNYKVISPTQAEKLKDAKVIGPRQWPQLQERIRQNEGKPSVAPAKDKRPALKLASVDDFKDETAKPADLW